MTDSSGTPIFVVKNDPEYGWWFFPYDIVTINEFIKARQEKAEESGNKSGAV